MAKDYPGDTGEISTPDKANAGGDASKLLSSFQGEILPLSTVTLTFIGVGCLTLFYLLCKASLERRLFKRGSQVDDKEKQEEELMEDGRNQAQFLGLQKSYLTVYLLGVAGDWLQGPYVYALYEAYGMSKHQIELLFIAGFASSLVFGTFIGSIADKYGRRTNLAITSGMAAQLAANSFGYVAPFDCALIILIVMAVIMVGTWPENYGDSKAPIHQSFVDAFQTIQSDRKVLFLGLVQSLFEGAMYTFVLEWTPALSRAFPTRGDDEKSAVPHGYVFASFMISVMIGSQLFKQLSVKFRPESLLRSVLLLSAFSLATPIIVPQRGILIFLSFCLFELCVGVFWPAMSYLRGLYLPEETRSTTMNFFRVPLNLIVVIILWQNFAIDTIFKFCVLALALAAAAQHFIYTMIKYDAPHQSGLNAYRNANELPEKRSLISDDDGDSDNESAQK
ncbi:sugar-tranasporter, 12 TM domain-containing protein [Ditylenchus destructor]|uniref:Sugar-tranasporter, 12 TM domain-containing protein n=1 Tax=Ditylenchus destructor TaxID=166010 RepID=A0AAD4R5A3_9BILA|nr:sugar-tranasporter, 12 TM domain-containing protein [Ditylenchus destructor]